METETNYNQLALGIVLGGAIAAGFYYLGRAVGNKLMDRKESK